jgi:hypothetical protein
VLPARTPELYFDHGRRRTNLAPAGPGRYSVPLGRSLVLAPVRLYIGDNATYEWKVDGVTRAGSTTEYFTFTPSEKGSYLVTVSARDGEARAETSTLVECVDPEGTYRRPVTPGSVAKVTTCYEFTPAPGQFVSIAQSATEASVRQTAQTGVNAVTDMTWAFSLGQFGGYIVTGFDHSVANEDGAYSLAIGGNAFAGWSEPGIIWVMQDENGNGQPDDTWYELKGSETGKPATKQRYSITYFKPDPSGGVWVDNIGNTGTFTNGYPYSVKGDHVTFSGTRLAPQINVDGLETSTGFDWGYVDNTGPSYFRVSDAVQVDGSPANLQYIDFVKVHTAINATSSCCGEISTETGIPFDFKLYNQ